ncbi:MAG: hypothetical protein AAFX50_09705, partial [Acidobacteriota bacterium]
MNLTVTHNAATAGPYRGMERKPGSFATIRAGSKTGMLGFKFDGSEAGDTLRLMYRHPQTGQWQTLVDSNKRTKQMQTDLGYLNAGQELQFKLVNRSKKKEYLSSTGMARIAQQPDGSLRVAFEDRVKGDNDYNDFVFTVYEKEPPKQVVVEAPKAQT